MDLELTGKTAIVTGGSSGIGKAIALGLAREGVDVAICARTKATLDAAAREIAGATKRKAVPIVCDVAKQADVERAVAEAAAALGGRIDILVNNAGQPGGLATGPLDKVTDDAILGDLNVKYMGYLRFARAVAPLMKQHRWGRIVHIGGNSARMSGTYSTGVRNIAAVHLSKTLADELGPFGITSNVVHPGLTRTPYVDGMIEQRAKTSGATPQEMMERMSRDNATRRIVDASEIAHLVVFLASPKSVAITGEVIAATGGAGRAVFA
jgi:NAD(P)-dependent dehydrogenase (short-subunit alcohol dehydrogenase family)